MERPEKGTNQLLLPWRKSPHAIRILEFISEIDENVRLLGVVAIVQGGTDGAEDGVEVIGSLYTYLSTVVQQLLDRVRLLGSGYAQHYIMVAPHTLLSLKLGGHELMH